MQAAKISLIVWANDRKAGVAWAMGIAHATPHPAKRKRDFRYLLI
jgi:hypothetical protein